MKTQQLYEALEKRAQAGLRNKGTRDTQKSAFEFLLPRENYVKSPKIHVISVILLFLCVRNTLKCYVMLYASQQRMLGKICQEGISFRNTYITVSELVF